MWRFLFIYQKKWEKKEDSCGLQDNENTYYRVFNYINVPMEVKKQKTKRQLMFLYLFSTIAVLKHMSLKENKVQFRKLSGLVFLTLYKFGSVFTSLF